MIQEALCNNQKINKHIPVLHQQESTGIWASGISALGLPLHNFQRSSIRAFLMLPTWPVSCPEFDALTIVGKTLRMLLFVMCFTTSYVFTGK